MATSEQWADIEQWATQTASSCDACLLELNERLKSLEEDCYEDNRSSRQVIEALVRRIEALEAKLNNQPTKWNSTFTQSKSLAT